jgi:hypothetical protein
VSQGHEAVTGKSSECSAVQCSIVKSNFQECGCEEKTLYVILGVCNSMRLL